MTQVSLQPILILWSSEGPLYTRDTTIHWEHKTAEPTNNISG